MSPTRVYLYELRRGKEIVATGQVSYERAPEIGARLTLAGRDGIVRSVIPILGENRDRLNIQLSRR